VVNIPNHTFDHLINASLFLEIDQMIEFQSCLLQPAQKLSESYNGNDDVTFHLVFDEDCFPIDRLLGVERDVEVASTVI